MGLINYDVSRRLSDRVAVRGASQIFKREHTESECVSGRNRGGYNSVCYMDDNTPSVGTVGVSPALSTIATIIDRRVGYH